MATLTERDDAETEKNRPIEALTTEFSISVNNRDPDAMAPNCAALASSSQIYLQPNDNGQRKQREWDIFLYVFKFV